MTWASVVTVVIYRLSFFATSLWELTTSFKLSAAYTNQPFISNSSISFSLALCLHRSRHSSSRRLYVNFDQLQYQRPFLIDSWSAPFQRGQRLSERDNGGGQLGNNTLLNSLVYLQTIRRRFNSIYIMSDASKTLVDRITHSLQSHIRYS